jgi:2-polyprenyl-3-methyl-5-hydroxy-6-metoxy-1,4-benzoquinol methylase
MPSKKSHPLAQDAYNALAEAYAQRVDTKAHNAYYERPATLSLLPEVRDKRVLDAGCGPGVYAEWLADHGAQVLALEGPGEACQSGGPVRFSRGCLV